MLRVIVPLLTWAEVAGPHACTRVGRACWSCRELLELRSVLSRLACPLCEVRFGSQTPGPRSGGCLPGASERPPLLQETATPGKLALTALHPHRLGGESARLVGAAVSAVPNAFLGRRLCRIAAPTIESCSLAYVRRSYVHAALLQSCDVSAVCG